MGICEKDKRVIFQEPFIKTIEANKFYDVIVPIQSIKDLTKGINIELGEKCQTSYETLKNKKGLKIGIIGNSNKGKSFILSKLSRIPIPFGTSISTKGLSIKYQDFKDFPNRNIILLDSAGLETPVIKTNKNKSIMNPQDNKIQNINIKNEDNKENDLFKEIAKEKILTELFLQDYIIFNSDILIVVVGILTLTEQKLLNKITTKIEAEKLKKNLFIIHNLMTFVTIEQVQNYINQTLLQSATFELEENQTINFSHDIPRGICFYEKNHEQNIYHLIFANEYSEAGKYYNEYTLSFIEKSFGFNNGLIGLDVVKTIKERFIEKSKDIIELNPQEIVEFVENSGTLIKLKTPEELTLKKFVIDELGFQNIKANGFEPNYNYYQTKDAIVVKIEIPGNYQLSWSFVNSGEYTIIKIIGNKLRDNPLENENNDIYNIREYGIFSINIPIKLDGIFIKNQKPKSQNFNGIIILTFETEKIIEGEKIESNQNIS